MHVSNDSFDWRKEASALEKPLLGAGVKDKIGEGSGHKMGIGLMEQHREMRRSVVSG